MGTQRSTKISAVLRYAIELVSGTRQAGLASPAQPRLVAGYRKGRSVVAALLDEAVYHIEHLGLGARGTSA